MQKVVKIFLVAVIAILAVSCNSTKETGETADYPNIILILSDDQDWGDYSFMGHESIHTPHIDQLAGQGMTFSQGYVPASLCRPSLASLVTGLYPHQHKILGNDPVTPVGNKHNWDDEFFKLRKEYNQKYIDQFEKLETLPDMLSKAGYLSFQSGKWWEGNFSLGGFDYGMTHGDPERGGRHGDEGLRIGREGMDPVFDFISDAREQEKPFFVWYAPFLPHAPHTPPDSLLQKYMPLAPSEPVAKYWAMCEFFDYTCGQLLGYVEEQGLDENTIVVYVCDNGWVQDVNVANRYAEPSKRSPYNTGVRTPIIFKWEDKISSGFNAEDPVSSTDIVPTLLSLVGLSPNEDMHGINILDKEKLKAREAIFGEISDHDFSSYDSSLFYQLVITQNYKAIFPYSKNKPGEKAELYKISEDPRERNDLAGEEPEVLSTLKLLKDEFFEQTQ